MLDEHHVVAFGIRDRGHRRLLRQVEGFQDDLPSQFRGLVQGRPKVAHLDVERHTASVASSDVPSGPRFGTTYPGVYELYRTIPDLPIEEFCVEGLQSIGIDRLYLPMNNRPRPVTAHATMV